VTADEPRWSASSDSRDDGPESDWRKVASVLKETLPPHAPWLDRQRAISAYWFCISATFANQSAVDRLKGEIERDFEAISKLHPRLDHLARIVVRVRGGQHFASVLARRPTLRYRWFGGLPAGLTAIDAYASVTARTFRKFLDTASLPYFSFAEFARENGIPAGGLHPDPDLLLAELIEGSRPALIVGGPGGIGKTRLALEIARAAERQGMLALSCGQRADDRAVEELARSHMKAADVLLFVDYAEAQNQLAAIAAAIEAANAAGHRLRLVATCRASAVSTVQQTLEDLGVRRLMLAGAESGPHAGAYLDWVVRRILAHGGIETIAGLAAVCAGLPVLAAFALHLHEERPETFARLFQGLAGDTSFEQWAGRRIALTLDRLGGSRAELRRRTAEIAAMLPLSVQETQRLRVANDAASAILDAFVADGWFDDDEGALLAAHDVFADALLAAHVFEAGIQPQPRARAMLREAHAAGALGRALAALDRLAGHARFGELDGAALMRSVREQDPQALAAVAQALLRSRLLAPAGLVELIAEDAALARELAEDRACHGPLSYAAERLARSGDESLRARGAVVIEPILEVALDRDEQPSNLLLRRAFALDPDRFAERALAEMRRAPDDHQTHFLIVAWLKAGRSPDALAAVVTRWLRAHAWANQSTSFVLGAWLSEGGDVETVRPDLALWLDRHAEIAEARYVYSAWLHAKGDFEAIAPGMRRWLCRHAEIEDASYVYATWLDGNRGVEAVAPDIRRWLDRHGEIAKATYVYAAWLDAKGGVDAVAPDIRRWLERHGEIPDASHVYRAWLGAKGAVDAVAQDIRRWLDRHAEILEASHVYAAWRGAKGSIDAVAPDIRRWLDRHAEIPEASYVYAAWLGAKGSIDAVAPDIRR